jgi:hypothetical protein
MRIHYSHSKIKELDKRIPIQEIGFKPRGFWVSMDEAWATFCKYAPGLPFAGKYKYKLNFPDEVFQNIISIYTEQELIDFHNEFAVERKFVNCKNLNYFKIDWPRVAEKYVGFEVILPDYNYTNDLKWVNKFDVNSGCLWDLGGCQIERIKK